jgi:hypothetical protein
MDWDTSADYLYAKVAEALHLGGLAHRERAMTGFLDEKTYRPGLESFRAESLRAEERGVAAQGVAKESDGGDTGERG